MNEIETREKGLVLCLNLLDKGIFTQADYESCKQIYTPREELSRAITGAAQGLPDARTSAEISFGMSAKQGKDDLGYDNAKRPNYQAFFRLVNSDLYYRQKNRKGKLSDSSMGENETTDKPENIYMSIRPDTGALYITQIDTSSAPEAANAVFNVELRQDGNYTIQNVMTKYYLRIVGSGEKTLIADNTELTDDCLFKQTPLQNNQFTFEVVKMPGYYLSAIQDNGLVLGISTIREGRVWELEFIDSADADAAENPDLAYDASEAKAIINEVLRDVKAARTKYYLLKSQIEYLEGLKTEIDYIVSQDGPVMSYYKNLAAARTPGMSNDVLESIAYSMKSEVESRQIYSLNQEINQLSLDAMKLEDAEMSSGSVKIGRIMGIIRKLTEERRKAISGLSLLLNKITTRQNALSSKEDILNKQQKYFDTDGKISEINSDISQKRGQYIKWEWYGLITLLTLIILAILFSIYKLWGRYSEVFLS